MSEKDPLEPVEVEIDGVLDLHHFNPREIKDLVSHYLDECVSKRIPMVRIIHGKGKGVLKQTVHSLLQKREDVLSFGLDSAGPSGWGATIIHLEIE